MREGSEDENGPERSKALRKKNKENEIFGSGKVKQIDELSNELSVLGRRVSRRQAISSGVAAGIGVAGIVIGAAAGYYAGGAGAGTKTQTTTATTTLPPVTTTVTQSGSTSISSSTLTSTATSTLTSTATSTTTVSSTGSAGPGIDYYYDPSLKGTTVNWLTASLPEKPPIFNNIALFEQETGIKVNLTVLSEGDANSKLATVFAAKSNIYDLVDTSGFGANAYAYWKQGNIATIANWLPKQPAGWNPSDIVPLVFSSVSTFKEDGAEVMGLPVVYANCGMYYRQDIFKSVANVPFPTTIEVTGTQTPGATMTWDEMLPLIPKVHNPPAVYGWANWTLPPIENVFPWEHFVWAYNKNYLHKDFTPNFSDPDVIAATDLWAQTSKNVPDPTTFGDGAEAALYASGNLAAGWSPESVIPQIFATGSKVTPDILRFANFPKVKVSPTFVAGSTMCISNYAQNPGGAFSLMSWITSPRMQNIFFKLGNATIRNSILTNPDYMASQDWFTQLGLQGAARLAKASKVGESGSELVWCPIIVKIPRAFDLLNNIGTELANILAGQETSAQGMAKLDTSATAILKDVGFYGQKTYDWGT